MKIDFKNKKQIILIAIIAITLAFIFGQSALPPSKSMEESDGVAETVDKILDSSSAISEVGGADGGEEPFGAFSSFVVTNLRKIAHFAEHGLLGFEIFILFCLAQKGEKKKGLMPLSIPSLLLSLNIGFLAGFLDESIQLLSGRESKMLDVWLDFSGYAAFTAVALLAAVTVNAVRSRAKSKMKS